MLTKVKVFGAGFLTFAVASFGLVGSAAAATTTQTVKGTVMQSGSSVANVTVNIACSGYNNIHQVQTNSAGKYTTTFSSNVCPIGQTITVSAEHGTASGSTSAALKSGTNTMNITLVSVALPEFRPLAAMTAIVVSIAVVWRLRLRQAASVR